VKKLNKKYINRIYLYNLLELDRSNPIYKVISKVEYESVLPREMLKKCLRILSDSLFRGGLHQHYLHQWETGKSYQEGTSQKEKGSAGIHLWTAWMHASGLKILKEGCLYY
jgi:hypothetical protein